MLSVVIAEGVAIALLAVLVLGLLRSHALILKSLHELGAGLELESQAASSSVGPVPVTLERGVVGATRPPTTHATDIVGSSLRGADTVVLVRGGGRRTLLAFLTSGCSVCQRFWDELRSGDVTVPGDARLVVVTKGREEESLSRLRELAGEGLEVVQSSGAWTDYAVPGSPYFVYVEEGLITGEGSSTTWAQVRDLMGQAVDDAADARRAAGGSPARDGLDTGGPDDLVRIDRELQVAGIHPGHPSLYEPPDGADPSPSGP